MSKLTFLLSTRWNAYRHSTGESMIEEILALGLDHVELGYDLHLSLVPGVRKLVDERAVRVRSVHNFCPVPIGAPFGHPELFALTSLDARVHDAAIQHTLRTAEFAAEIGAGSVVVHAGNVEMKGLTRQLMAMAEAGEQYSPKYEKIKNKLLLKRDKKATRHLEPLDRAIERMLPTLQNLKVRICLENLPSWEGIPSEVEMEQILTRFDVPEIRYWHDMGHAQVRQNLGFISHRRWMEKLRPWMAGLHVHDVAPPAHDHLMPPEGQIDFAAFKPLVGPDLLLVLEPMPGTPTEQVAEGLRLLRAAWEDDPGSANPMEAL